MRKNRHWLLTMAMLLCSITVSAHGLEVDGIYYNITSETDLTVEVTYKGSSYNSYYGEYKGELVIPSIVVYDNTTYSVTSIKEYTFRECSYLTSVTVPSSVKSIGYSAFSGCDKLVSIDLGDGLVSLGYSAFSSCESLTSIIIPEGVTIIDESTFAFSGLASITIPKSVTSIGAGAFSSCSSLASITIPESVTSVGSWAFDESENLESFVSLSSVAPTLGTNVFPSSASSNATLFVPNGSAESYAEAGWTSYFASIVEMNEYVLATSLTLNETRVSLKAGNTSKLTASLSPETVSVPILAWTSSSEDVATVDAEGTITAVGYGEAVITVRTTDGSNLSASCNVAVSVSGNCGENLTWILTDGELMIEGEGAMPNYMDPKPSSCSWAKYADFIKKVTVGEGVTTIGEFNFCEYDNLTTVDLPTSLISIGAEAFEFCDLLTSIEIPEGVTSIGFAAFADCNKLAAIAIPSTVVDVGYYAFINCSSLGSFSVDANNPKYDSRDNCNALIETATNTLVQGVCCSLIPESVTSIGLSAFNSDMDLASIVIPNSVTSIGDHAFAYCQALTAVTLGKDLKSIGQTAFEECSELSSVTSLSPNAPSLGGDAFASISSSAVLTIPSGSTSSYEDAGWTSYFSSVVEMEEDVLATSLALDVTEASLAPNETLSLTAALLPEDVTNPALSWASSNESVATVDANGVVTAVADGEATITVSTTDGSELSASCEVRVETEVVVEYENKIYFEDVTAFSNSSVSHPLQLKNTVDMTAVQFDLYLPEGVTLATDTRGRYAITFNAGRADNTTHTLSSALQSDGAIRVLCYSTESYEFLGSEGTIFYFPLEISEMEDGDYDVVIKNIVLTDVSGTKYEIPSMTSTITVLNVAPGDCNADNTIDVADIVVLANHILGTTATDFVEKAADYNADGAVDVADIVNIANYILNGNNAAARSLVREVMSTRAADATYSLDILPFVLEAEGSKTIALDLTDPTESFTAFQCDLYLPEGVSVDKDNRGRYAFSFNEERTDASCHTLSSALQEDGAIRVLCYSADIYNFLGTEGALLNIPLTADASLANGVYEFSIANTVLTYVNAEKVSPETYKGSIVVGDGGKVEGVKLYGRYTSEVLNEYTTAFGTNAGITCMDLTEAIYLAEGGLLATGNPNTIVYLAEGDALANESNVVSGDECVNLVLTDGYAFSAPTSFSASQTSYGRELAEGKYGTIVLPFAPNTDDYVFYALTSATDDMLTFDEVENPVANTPYLYKLRDGKSATQITNSEVAVSSELTSVGTPVWQMVGSFTNQTIVTSEDEDKYYYAYTSSDNQVHQVTNTLTVKPYRAYFTTSSVNNMQLAVRTRSGEETLIDASEVDGLCPEVYYDLSGRRVDNPTKGVYIVNGKKVVF